MVHRGQRARKVADLTIERKGLSSLFTTRSAETRRHGLKRSIRRHKGVFASIGFAGLLGLAGLAVTLYNTFKPPATPELSASLIGPIKPNPSTLGQYLDAEKLSRSQFKADELSSVGWKFEIQANLKGYGGKQLHLQASFQNVATREPASGSISQIPPHNFVPPRVPTYQSLQWAWAPNPSAAGAYFAKLQLYDPANKPLAFYDSDRDPGNRFTLECGSACIFKGPS
jgi:hypothetical protein